MLVEVIADLLLDVLLSCNLHRCFSFVTGRNIAGSPKSGRSCKGIIFVKKDLHKNVLITVDFLLENPIIPSQLDEAVETVVVDTVSRRLQRHSDWVATSSP